MYPRVKRVLDVTLSVIGLTALSPLILGLCAIIRLTSPGPALFRQKRIGKDGTPFTILKLRTMRKDTPGNVPTHLMTDWEAYITPVGRFMRMLSLDELPQLINVIRGDMSLVGPRPALWNQYDLITAREAAGVQALRPGLTGWAQINGRDTLTIPEKVRLDAEYLRRMSFAFDLRCLLGTVFCVLRGKGVVEGGTGEMSHD